MNALIPLVLVFLLINHKKLKEDQNYRVSVFSVIGVTFFFILRFVDYYFSTFDHPSFYYTATKIIVVATVVALCLSPVFVKSSPVKASICVVVFILGVFFSFAMERPLKIFIANGGGYFDGTDDSASRYDGSVVTYTNKEGGYSLLIPEYWDKKSTNDGLTYFFTSKENVSLLELRPRCFHDTDLVITEIVQNLKDLDAMEDRSTKTKCTGDTNIQKCLVKSIEADSNRPMERWRWLVMNVWSNQNIEVDVLFFSGDEEIKQQVQFVLASMTTTSLRQPKPTCLNPMEWF